MTPKIFTKTLGVLILVMVILEALFLGYHIKAGNVQGIIIDTVMLAFWSLGAAWYHSMRLREQKTDMDHERQMKEVDDSIKHLIDDTLGKIKEKVDHETEIENALEKATSSVAGDHPRKALRPSQYPAVEKKFHELLPGHYLQLELNKNDPRGRAVATISDKPFEKPATKKAPVKRPVAKNAPAKKTVTTKKGK